MENAANVVLSLTWLEIISITFAIISFALNVYQFLIWRRDRKTIYRPIYNSLLGLFNDIKAKSTNTFWVYGALWSPNNPHREVATLRWEYGVQLQSSMNALEGFREVLVGVLSTLNPDDPKGETAFKASDYGWTPEERKARDEFMRNQRAQIQSDSKSSARSGDNYVANDQ